MKTDNREWEDYSSVETIECRNKVSALFSTPLTFREDKEIAPRTVKGWQYMPWGASDDMCYNVLDRIEADETMAVCQQFNAELLYGSGLQYNTEGCTQKVKDDVEDFFMANNIPAYFMGCAQDIKHFGFCVTVLLLNKDCDRIAAIRRKDAVSVRFAPVKDGKIPYILYGNFRLSSPDEVEKIELLDFDDPLTDLRERIKEGKAVTKFAMMTLISTPEHTYYPIPYYGAIFRSKWYDIKQLLGTAKKAVLENHAPIKYQVEVSRDYWDRLFNKAKAATPQARQGIVRKKKQEILDFLTGAENSGKSLFSEYYVSPDGKTEMRDIRIVKIDTDKQGGDYATDIQEAINMICFTMRVHPNLVGSVPGKSQMNNSGSDKRELYTIQQALQLPYRDIMFQTHRVIIRFNEWKGAKPEVPFIQLTTLDEHGDAKRVKTDESNDDNG